MSQRRWVRSLLGVVAALGAMFQGCVYHHNEHLGYHEDFAIYRPEMERHHHYTGHQCADEY